MKATRHTKILELIERYEIETQEELSDYLGVARPSLSRTLMQMQSEGIIKVEKKQMQILDVKKIRTLCN